MSLDKKQDPGECPIAIGDTMKFTILLKSEDDSSAPLMLSQIERTGPLNAATLGLTLAESKCLLANVQQELVESQVQNCGQELLLAHSIESGDPVHAPVAYDCG